MTKLGSGLVCTALVLMYLSYTTAQLQNIYDVAKKGGLTTLVTALDVAGLDGVFKKNGTYTVFAPTNEAFKKLPAGALDNLLKMPEHLSEVLRYHVLPALVQSSMIVNGTKSDSLLPNSSIHITIDSNGRVMINNAAVVTTADVQASNGVVHIIDTVLMPPMPSTERKAEPEPSSEPKAEPHSEPEPEYEPEPESEPKPVMPNPRTAARTYDDEDFSGESSGYSSEEYDNMYNGSSILDVAMQSRLTTLVALIEQAGLTQALSAQGPFTIMAPHDDSGFGTFAMPELVNDPENLKILLSYHVIPGKVMASDLTDGMEANTLAGEMMMFHVSKAGVTLNGSASKVIKADVVASNGVIHIIDKVLVPEKLMKKPGNIIEELKGKNMSSLVKFLDLTDLTGVLEEQGEYSLFAPSEAALVAANDYLMQLMTDELRDILLNHVVPEKVTSFNFSNDLMLGTSLSNAHKIILNIYMSNDGRGTITTNGAAMVKLDVLASNGVIHVVDEVLLPTMKNFEEIITKEEDLKTFTTIVDGAQFGKYFDNGGPFTILAPTDDAFKKLPAGLMANLTSDTELMVKILKEHVLQSAVYREGMNFNIYENLQGGIVGFSKDNAGVTIVTSQATITNAVVTDIRMKNGVLHKISDILIH